MSPRHRAIRPGFAVAMLLAAASPALGQAPTPPVDTAARIDTVAAIRAELTPPLSPRKAFLYSLVLPGYAQSVLGRHRAGALLVAFEAMSIVMVRMSLGDLREVRRNLADSIPVSFVTPTGAPGIRYERTPFNEALVRARRAHVEDWIAVLAANHLFSALDAYVAAQLWDLPAEVALRGSPGSAALALKLHW